MAATNIEWVVSQGDVEKHPKYRDLSLSAILKLYGMDINKGYTAEEATPHRSVFTGELHDCMRYLGVSRTDGDWKRFCENFVEL